MLEDAGDLCASASASTDPALWFCVTKHFEAELWLLPATSILL